MFIYEARKYGIHSAMPSNVAYKRCPYAHLYGQDLMYIIKYQNK